MEAMKNTFLTQQDAEKFKFNEEAKLPANSQEVVIYYLYLINLAADLGIISKERSNQVAANLMNFIFVDVDERCAAGVNLQYIISSYLLTFSHYDALRKVLNYNEGKGLINEAKEWYFKTISSLKRNLAGIYADVQMIQAENVTNTYEEFSNAIENLESSLRSTTKFSFKNAEWTSIYELVSEVHGVNYIDTLKKALKAFSIEVKIIKKFNGNELLEDLRKEFKKFSGQYHVVDKKEKLEIELQKLEKTYKEKMERGWNLENRIDTLIQKFDESFGEEYPDLDEYSEEYEEALEEFIVSEVGEYEPFDENELEREYKKKKLKIIHQLNKLDDEVSEFDFEKISSQGELVEDYISLTIILKEYAVFEKCNSGIWQYPESIEERAKLYNKVDLNETIKKFIKNFRSILSSYEIVYLQAAKF